MPTVFEVRTDLEWATVPDEYSTDEAFYLEKVKALLPLFEQYPQVEEVCTHHEEAPDSHFIYEGEQFADLNDIGEQTWREDTLKIERPHKFKDGSRKARVQIQWYGKFDGGKLWVRFYVTLEDENAPHNN